MVPSCKAQSYKNHMTTMTEKEEQQLQGICRTNKYVASRWLDSS